MRQKDSIIIKTNKKSIIIGLIGSLVFIIVGLFMITKPDSIGRYSESIIQTCGIIGNLFFGLTSIYLTKKIYDKKAGLIMDKSGLVINTSIISKHSIKWDELRGTDLTKIGKEKILFLYLNDSKGFIKKFNPIEQFLMRLNLSIYGSPNGISMRSINYDIDKLTRQIQYRIKNWAQQSIKPNSRKCFIG